MSRRGFALIELLTVMVVMGVLASIALPKYQQFRKRAQSAEIVTDMVAVRTAAFAYNESNGTWPPTAALGQVPTGLAPYLPESVLFQQPDYSLGWSGIAVSGAKTKGTTQLVWVSTTDGVLCQGVSALWGGSKNVDVTTSCSAKGGTVMLFVDH